MNEEVWRLVMEIHRHEKKLQQLRTKLETILNGIELTGGAEPLRSFGKPSRGSLKATVTAKMLSFVTSHPGRGFTPAELASAVGSTNSASVRQLIIRLEKSGKVTKLERGRWGVPSEDGEEEEEYEDLFDWMEKKEENEEE